MGEVCCKVLVKRMRQWLSFLVFIAFHSWYITVFYSWTSLAYHGCVLAVVIVSPLSAPKTTPAMLKGWRWHKYCTTQPSWYTQYTQPLASWDTHCVPFGLRCKVSCPWLCSCRGNCPSTVSTENLRWLSGHQKRPIQGGRHTDTHPEQHQLWDGGADSEIWLQLGPA